MRIEERVGQRVERRALGHRRRGGTRQFEHARKIIQRWLKACECQVSSAAFLVEVQISFGLLLTGEFLDETERVAIVPLRIGVGVELDGIIARQGEVFDGAWEVQPALEMQ